MSNSNVHVPTNATCCDGGEEVSSPPAQSDAVGLVVFFLLLFGLCLLIIIFSSLYKKIALHQAHVEAVASHESKEEKRRKRKELISNGLIVNEWVPDDLPVDSSEGDQDTPATSGEAVEAPQPPALPINSSPASCVIRSDDCESLAGEEEDMEGCAICLSRFKPQQIVCKSSNLSCQHVFHRDCMVDWLMKSRDNCPMCRAVYLLETV
jgi:hypothetical protein